MAGKYDGKRKSNKELTVECVCQTDMEGVEKDVAVEVEVGDGKQRGEHRTIKIAPLQ